MDFAVRDDSEAQKITSIWIDQFNQFTPGQNATIILRKGHSPAGNGVYRTIDVHVAGSILPLDDETGHYWQTETDQTYSGFNGQAETDGVPPTFLVVSFPWQPGQTIQIKVYGERQTLRSGARPLYINTLFSGPVALWEMAQTGQIVAKVGDGEHRLEFEVLNCPGPPPPPREMERLKSELP